MKKARKKNPSRKDIFFCYSMKSEKENLNGGKTEIFAESPVCTMEIVLTEVNEILITPLEILKLPLTQLTGKMISDMICNSFIPLNVNKFLHFLLLVLFIEKPKHIRTENLRNKVLYILKNHVKSAVISNKKLWFYLAHIICVLASDLVVAKVPSPPLFIVVFCQIYLLLSLDT